MKPFEVIGQADKGPFEVYFENSAHGRLANKTAVDERLGHRPRFGSDCGEGGGQFLFVIG